MTLCSKSDSESRTIFIHYDMAYFSKSPLDMLGCVIKQYNGATQPIEERKKMEVKKRTTQDYTRL